MSERDQVVSILKKAISPPFKAVMGRGDGTVVVDGRPGHVWVRKLGRTEMLMQAYNRGAPAIEGIIILIQESRIDKGGYEVIGTYGGGGGDGNVYPPLPPHAWTHEWRPGIGRDRVTVYPRAWGYLRAEPIATGSMNVWVTPGWLYYDGEYIWYPGGYSPAFGPPTGSTWYQTLYMDPSDQTLHIINGVTGGYGYAGVPVPPDCMLPIAAVESTGTFGTVTENMIEDIRLFMDPIEDCGEAEIGMATGILVSLVNHTGGLRTVGDVVVTDPNHDESFTGTLIQGYAGKILVVAETIPNLLTGTLWERGGPFDVETEGIIARNDGLRTSGTLFLAEATASPTGTGVFAIALSPSAGPTGAVKALFLDEVSAPGGGDGGVTTIEIQEDDVKVTDADVVNFEGGGGKVTDEGGGKVTVNITPGAGDGGAWTLIEDVELAAPAASIDFQNIPQTHKHLVILFSLRSDRDAESDALGLRFNNSSVGYDWVRYYVQAAGLTATEGINDTEVTSYLLPSATAPAGSFGPGVLHFNDYVDTSKFPGVLGQEGVVRLQSAAGVQVGLHYGQWRTAAAISRITLLPIVGNNFVAASRATLYGIS